MILPTYLATHALSHSSFFPSGYGRAKEKRWGIGFMLQDTPARPAHKLKPVCGAVKESNKPWAAPRCEGFAPAPARAGSPGKSIRWERVVDSLGEIPAYPIDSGEFSPNMLLPVSTSMQGISALTLRRMYVYHHHQGIKI